MEIRKFGVTKNGREVNIYTLKNDNGMKAEIMNLGAALVSLYVPDKDGEFRDVVLGYDKVSDYEEDSNCFGAVIGRNANRIKGTHITLDGFDYILDDNDNGNNLHSGFSGFQREIWSAVYEKDGHNRISFCMDSEEGTQGFPGTVHVTVSYELTEENELIIYYEAQTNRKTIVNLTNHTYFNLDGHDSGSIENQELCILADFYNPVEQEGLCPTGEITSVSKTPFDFRKMKAIGQDINSDYNQLAYAGGYDHNFVNNNYGELKLVASALSGRSKIAMDVYTDRPGMQFYTGNFIEKTTGKNNAQYDRRHGFCLETQNFPDAIHHDNFPSSILEPKKKFTSTTEFVFYVKN